jgi:hypothetical protein
LSRLKARIESKAAELPVKGKAQASDTEQDVLDNTLRSARLSVYSKNERNPVMPAGYTADIQNLKSRFAGFWNKKVMRRAGGSDGPDQIEPSSNAGLNVNGTEDLRTGYSRLMYELEKTRGSKLYYESRAEKLESDITVLNDKIQMLTKKSRPLKSGRNLFVGACCGILLTVLIGAGLIFSGVIRLDRAAGGNDLLTQAAPYQSETIETGVRLGSDS